MKLIIKIIIALFGLILIVAFLDRQIYHFIEENSPTLKSYEGLESYKPKKEPTEEEIKTMSIENANPKEDLNLDTKTSFCEADSEDAQNITKRCKALTKENCKSIDCCVLLNGKVCVAGGKDGATEGEAAAGPYDYYYYQSKCYGKCPNNKK
jgi:hypothetical protein